MRKKSVVRHHANRQLVDFESGCDAICLSAVAWWRYALMLLFLCIATPSMAFKLDTHLWVGQQVINDLDDDGQINIVLYGRTVQLPIRQDVRDAILQNRNEYMLGHIGPDAMPDVIVGQSFMHPDILVDGAWKPNDWMKYMQQVSAGNAKGKAYTYGYLGHASSDLFAHTYVNQYAGNVFSLTDDEVLVETRHFALENYIGKRTPQLRDRNGQWLGEFYNIVRPSPELNNFIRDTLIYDPRAEQQYRKKPELAPHLIAFRRYRMTIDGLATSNTWQRLDASIAKYVGLPQMIQHVERLQGKLNGDIDLAQSEIDELNQRMTRLETQFAQRAQSSFNRVQALESDLFNAQYNLQLKINQQICENCPRLYYPCPSWSNPFRMCSTTEPVCAAHCRVQSQVLADIAIAREALRQQRQRMLNEMTGLHADLVASRNDVIQLNNALVDLGQIPLQSANPIQAIAINWRNDTDAAFSAYVGAATQAMVNTMNKNASSRQPLQSWLDCYGPSLAGVPAVVSSCANQQSAKNLLTTLQRLADLPGNGAMISLGLPTAADIRQLRANIEADAIDDMRRYVERGIVSLLPPPYENIVNTLRDEPTEAYLRTAFTNPEPGNKFGLLYIGDIDQRVNREMNLSDGYFDPQQFAAAYNAVVLSKLALLDNAGLLQLELLANGNQPAGSSGGYAFAGTQNIIADAITSLDGNHQWLQTAPPRPVRDGRSTGPIYPGKPLLTGFRSPSGFVPWDNHKLRNALFRAMFIGPLSPGIESASEIGLGAVLPETASYRYPYRPCRTNPFPDYLTPNEFGQLITDQSCDQKLMAWQQPYAGSPNRGPAFIFKANENFAMTAGQVRSNNGVHLAYQMEGNLVVYTPSGAVWGTNMMSPNTANRSCYLGGCVAVLQSVGNLVLYERGWAYWASHSTSSSGGRMLVSPVEPYLLVEEADGTPMFSSSANLIARKNGLWLRAGMTSWFQGGRITYDADGNLGVYATDGSLLWSTQTPVYGCTSASCVAVFQGDGNLVLYKNWQWYWASHTNGDAISHLRIGTQPPYLSIHRQNGDAIWNAPPMSAGGGGPCDGGGCGGD
jgi:hypothetical protein